MNPDLERAIQKALEFLLDDHREEGPVLDDAEAREARQWLESRRSRLRSGGK